jgi:hypothetical protein
MSTPRDLLTFEEFKTSLDDFQQNYLNHKPITLESVWIEFAKLKEYLNYIETAANDKRISISGIRFHLIAENNHISMALSPTVEDDEKHVCFDPHKSTTGQPALLNDLMNDRSVVNSTSDVLNKVNPCPPKCGGGK